MGNGKRTELQQQIVDTLLESKAIDFQTVSTVFGQFAGQAARDGDSVGFGIYPRVFWACGWPVLDREAIREVVGE